MHGLARIDRDGPLGGQARVEPGTRPPGQRLAEHDGSRRAQSTLEAEELPAIARHRHVLRGRAHEIEPDPLVGVAGAPRIADDHGPTLHLRAKVPARVSPVEAEDRLGVGGDPQAPPGSPGVGDREERQLDGVLATERLGQLETQSPAGVGVGGVAEAVSGNVSSDGDRCRRRGEDDSGVLVPDVERLGDGLADRIVAPRGDLVVPAVAPPRVSGALSRRVEPEPVVRDDVGPGRRRGPGVLERDDVLGSVAAEPAEPVGEEQVLLGGRGVLRRAARPLRGRGSGQVAGVGGQDTGELVAQVTTRGDEVDRCGPEQGQVTGLGELVGTDDMDAARRLSIGWRCGRRQVLQLVLQLLGVGRGPPVDHHQVGGESHQLPVRETADELSHQSEIRRVIDREHHDRQVPGDAHDPERRLRVTAGQEGRLGGPKHRVGERHVPGQCLELVGLTGGDAQVSQLDLGLCPGHGLHAGPGGRAAVLVEELEDLLTTASGRGPPGQDHFSVRGHRHGGAERGDGVEGPAGRASAGELPGQSSRAGDVVAPTQERPTVRLDERRGQELWRLEHTDGGNGLDHQHLPEPQLGVGMRATLPRGEHGAEGLVVLGVHEHLAEGRMGGVVTRGTEHQLGVGRAIHRPPGAGLVAETQPLDRDARLGADGPVELRAEAPMAPAPRHGGLGEPDLVGISPPR